MPIRVLCQPALCRSFRSLPPAPKGAAIPHQQRHLPHIQRDSGAMGVLQLAQPRRLPLFRRQAGEGAGGEGVTAKPLRPQRWVGMATSSVPPAVKKHPSPPVGEGPGVGAHPPSARPGGGEDNAKARRVGGKRRSPLVIASRAVGAERWVPPLPRHDSRKAGEGIPAHRKAVNHIYAHAFCPPLNIR